MVRRAAAVLAPAVVWCGWTVLAPLAGAGDSRLLTETSVVAVAIPLAAVMAIALAFAFGARPFELGVVLAAAAAVALGATLAGLPTGAGAGKILAGAAIGMLATPLLERPWHAALVAVLIVGVDTYSVFYGPTKQLLEGSPDVLGWFTVPLSGLGRYGAGELGAPDFLFLGLFASATLRWRLRPEWTLPAMVASFAASLAIATALDAAVPALPLLSLAFVAPNVRRLLPSAPVEPRADRNRPATTANARRNASGRVDRAIRWVPARDALWAVLDPLVREGARVAIVGAGNCDDLPLTRLIARCGRLDLLDVDPAAAAAAIRREPRGLREHARAVEVDVTGGAADRIVAATAAGRLAPAPLQDWEPIGDAPYDLVVGDLVYSQLLYPGLIDAGVVGERIGLTLRSHGQATTGLAVSRLHASAPGGVVVHVDDPLAWWDGHPQPFTIVEVLAAARGSAEEALGLIATGNRPTGSDPRESLAALGIPVRSTHFWRWPFTTSVDYLVCATVAGPAPR